MTTKTIRSLLSLALITLTAAPAFADGGVFVGSHSFPSSGEGIDPVGVSVGARFTWFSRARLSTEAELAVAHTSRSDGEMTAVGYRAHGLYDLGREGSPHPFLILGLGGETAAGLTGFQVHSGLGVKIPLGKGLGIRSEARLILPFDDSPIGSEMLFGIYSDFGGSKAPARIAPAEIAGR
jgi:hypothetical protein